jgi:hypothetical protein
VTPAASSDEEDDVPATAVKQRRKERADEHHKVMAKQRREKERAESCPDGLTTEDSSSAAISVGIGEEQGSSGARVSYRVSLGVHWVRRGMANIVDGSI